MSRVTVVVPVFNNELTLSKCLNSIEKQTFRDFSVVVVDDGSTDSSVETIEQWVKKNKKFTFVRNTSHIHGASVARNVGLREVESKWVTFVDSDDWIDTDYLQVLMEMCNVGEFCASSWTRSVVSDESPSFAKLYSSDVLIIKALGMKEVSGFIWGKLFDMDVIREFDIAFNEKLTFSEDLLFVVSYLKEIDNGCVSNKRSYHYIERDGSVSNFQNIDSIFAELKAMKRIFKVFEDRQQGNIYRAVRAHEVKVYNSMFVKAIDINDYWYQKLLKILRYRMFSGMINYFLSGEYIFHMKISVLMNVCCPYLAAHLRRLKGKL